MRKIKRNYSIDAMMSSTHRSRRLPGLDIKHTTEDDALERALAYIRRVIRKGRRAKRYVSIGILFRKSRDGTHWDEIFRVKSRFRPRDLLAVRDPRECFVKGYGPKALAKLDT